MTFQYIGTRRFREHGRRPRKEHPSSRYIQAPQPSSAPPQAAKVDRAPCLQAVPGLPASGPSAAMPEPVWFRCGRSNGWDLRQLPAHNVPPVAHCCHLLPPAATCGPQPNGPTRKPPPGAVLLSRHGLSRPGSSQGKHQLPILCIRRRLLFSPPPLASCASDPASLPRLLCSWCTCFLHLAPLFCLIVVSFSSLVRAFDFSLSLQLLHRRPHNAAARDWTSFPTCRSNFIENSGTQSPRRMRRILLLYRYSRHFIHETNSSRYLDVLRMRDDFC